MSRAKRLIQSYTSYISVPWRDDAAAAQRVVFCVYNETEELSIVAKVDEFEIATRQAGHNWAIFDLTNTFAVWLASQRYAERVIFRNRTCSLLFSQNIRHLSGKNSVPFYKKTALTKMLLSPLKVLLLFSAF